MTTTEPGSISLFTDITNVELVDRHRRGAALVLRRIGEVEPHTMPSGLAATFSDPAIAFMCAVQIQRSFEDWGKPGDAPVRVGIAHSNDEAERVTARARGGEILVTEAIRALTEPRGYLFTARSAIELDGTAVPLFAVRWWEHD